MAWNPSPKVAAARDFGQKFEKDQVVIIGINQTTGQYELVTYGKTKALCADTEKIGDAIARMIKDGTISLD